MAHRAPFKALWVPVWLSPALEPGPYLHKTPFFFLCTSA